jgi:farnesyl diphosphate synthase
MSAENASGTQTLEIAMTRAAHAVEDALSAILPEDDSAGAEAHLFEAMRYSTLGSGKRLRPFLVLTTAALFEVPEAVAVRAGTAVELIHTYSLIHDDLPCMDDDPLRRGKPSCHIKFGEATAVLAGDALMPLAFEVLSDPVTHPDAAIRVALVSSLAVASGARGMVGGQMLDLAAEDKDMDAGEIAHLERLKTGALIAFACDAGAILGRASDSERRVLAAYAHDLGLAYQMADDLLDVEGDSGLMGKATGKDAARGKATFVAALGADETRTRARLLADQAAAHLEPFGARAKLLRDVARFVVERRA